MKHDLATKLRLRQFHYFAVLAQYRSLTAAAAQLQITQPSLSEFVARLESDFGTKLILPTVHGIELTRAGKAFAEHSCAILERVDRAIEHIAELSDDTKGHVAIGIVPPLSHAISVPLAETIALEHPNIRLLINEGLSRQLVSETADSELDFCICYQGADLRNFNTRPLLDEELFVLVPADDWPTGDVRGGVDGRPIGLEDLVRHPLILPLRGGAVRNVFDQAANARNLRMNVILELNSTPNTVAMVSRASSYAVLSHAAALKEVREGSIVLVPFDDPAMKITSYIVRKRGREVSPASLLVERTVLEVLTEMIEKDRLRASLRRMPDEG